MPIKLIQDLPAEYQRSGFRGAAQWLIRYLVSVPYEHIVFDVFVRSLEEPLPVGQPNLPIVMRLATEADLPRLREMVLPSEYQHFAQRLTDSRYCFLALLKDDQSEIVSYCWATTEIDPDIDNLNYDLPSGAAYLDDAFTRPTCRRQGIQTAVHLFRLEYLKSLGCRQVLLIVDVKNHASQKLVRKLAYQKIGQATFLRVFRSIITPLTIVLPEELK